MGVLFLNGCCESHQLLEQDPYHKKMGPGGAGFTLILCEEMCVQLASCTTCFIAVFVFASQVGNLLTDLAVFVCVAPGNQTMFDSCACAEASVCSLSSLALIIFVCVCVVWGCHCH